MDLIQLNQSISGAVQSSIKTAGSCNVCDIKIPVVSGKSAYEVAIEYGYVGSESAWIASLKVKGDKGDIGQQGIQGIQGIAGNDVEAKKAIQDLSTEIQNLRDMMAQSKLPVGGVFTTTVNYNSGSEVKATLGYGTWARYAQGKILAGYSLLASDIPEYKTMGNAFGENSHTLTVAEMPKHNHGSNMRFEAGEAILVDAELATKVDSGDMLDHMNEDTTASTNTTYSGNNQPHNNLQPSIVVGYWLRTQ